VREVRGIRPVLLLDDVASELDTARRERLVGELQNAGGQAILTATEPAQIPGAGDAAVATVAVEDLSLSPDEPDVNAIVRGR